MEAGLEGGVRGRAGDRSGGSLRGAFWLAREDVRRTWASYPASCLGVLFLGFIAISPVQGVFEVEGLGVSGGTLQEGVSGTLVDSFFLCVCPMLGVNFVLNRDYGARYRQDNMSRRLAFLRGLAISPGEIVVGRALTMLLAFVVAVPSFFLPLFLVSPGAVESMSAVEFCGFAAIWVGYALFAAGFYMYGWLGFSGRQDLKGTLGLVPCLLLAAILANFVFGIHLVSGSVGLAREHGPLAAVPALVIGVAGFILCGLATAKKLSRRDLSV